MRPSAMAFVFALALGLAVFVQPAAPRPTHPTSSRSERWPLTSPSRAPHATESLQDPVRLSDLRGEVVVLAFFFRARTRG